MSEIRAFAPLYRPSSGTGTGTLVPSVTVACSTSHAASAQLPGMYDGNGSAQILVSNATESWAYINFGIYGNVPAATVAASLPIPPGASLPVTVPPEVSGADVILSAGTGNVIFTRGEGV
ncbi:hypothetical protein UFOVP154_37 [uncultured Caudovirales phage]|uniref:Uncharacterized protein n=1 Tax=uncultured Caudovirales phage TaxID=2100421 RepID=A0A6J7W9X0_9CAUD|nr:hypothetical protein UFOVP8_22 [uncultured Caudovirales phage]CAB5170617.1 hypothetical protein UFOVP154_37 [uncultured Caudovirales phage]